MKYLALLVLGLTMACNSSQKTVPAHTTGTNSAAKSIIYAKTITEAELKEHLYIYASDEYEGRETGKPGQKMASEYIKNEYLKLGIPSAKDNGEYFQNVPLKSNGIPSGKVTFNGKEHVLGENILGFSTAKASFKDIVYAGYGIDDPAYSDFEGLNIEGKLVLAKFGEPINDDGTYKLSGSKKKSVWSNMSEGLGVRSKTIADKGGVGILYVDDSNFAKYRSHYNRMKNKASNGLTLKPKDDGFISLILDKKSAKNLIPDIFETHTPQPLKTSLDIDISSGDEISSENVVAFIEGSTKPHEYIVISSHLDHIGITKSGKINNGADDDGSGTVALLEIAEAFKEAQKVGNGPKRSIVFLHVTGEEKGLLGSQYYTDIEPIFPLAQTVANLNIDMIGRIDPKREGARNYIYLIGSDKLSTDLHNLSEDINKKYSHLELDYKYNDENDPNRFYYRSDHYNFAKNNIPIIFYFNGTHDDYHRPSDTPDKINYDLLENRTRLIFHTAWEIANREQRVIVDKPTK